MAHGVEDKYSKYKRTREILNEELPMNDLNGQFYLEKAIQDEYQDGLASKQWNPTQVLYEIASKSQWPQPEFAKISYTTNPPSFLYSVIVKDVHFVAKTGASTKKVAQHHASSEFLRFLGFSFEFAKMKKKIYPQIEKECHDNIEREDEMEDESPYKMRCHNEERLCFEDRVRACRMSSREHIRRHLEECFDDIEREVEMEDDSPCRKRCHIEKRFCHEDRGRSCRVPSREHIRRHLKECLDDTEREVEMENYSPCRKRCHVEKRFCHEDRVRACRMSSRGHLWLQLEDSLTRRIVLTPRPGKKYKSPYLIEKCHKKSLSNERESKHGLHQPYCLKCHRSEVPWVPEHRIPRRYRCAAFPEVHLHIHPKHAPSDAGCMGNYI